MMTYTFTDTLPDDIHTTPLLISGVNSLAFEGIKFLWVHTGD